VGGRDGLIGERVDMPALHLVLHGVAAGGAGPHLHPLLQPLLHIADQRVRVGVSAWPGTCAF